MPGGNKNIKPEDGKQFSKEYQPAEKWSEKISLKFANDLLNWMDKEDENIFFDDFLFNVANPKDYGKNNRIYPAIIDYLCDKFSSFSKLIEIARKKQEIKLKKFGCFDKLNATMTKFTLINNHNWTDRNQTDHTTKGKEITSIELSVIDEAKS